MPARLPIPTLLLAAAALSAALASAARAAPVTQALVARCDVLASHPADPDRVAPGLARAEMDLLAAEAACRLAHGADPDHARTAYHLGRAIFYQGRQREALPFLERSAAAGYRQAIFVLGYVLSLGGDIPADLCRAQHLWRRGVALDHPWSAYHLIATHLDGRFAGCDQQPSAAELAGWQVLMRDRISISASAGRVEALSSRLAAAR